MVRLLDAAGSWRLLRQRGRLQRAKHSSVMTALDKKASRFDSRKDSESERDRQLLSAAFKSMEEDGRTARPVSNSNNNSKHSEEAMEIQQLLIEKAAFLDVLGDSPGKKSEGVFRIAYENTNTLPARLHNNDKLDKLKHVIDDMELDILGLNEHRNNLKHKDCRRHGIVQLFDGGESLVRGLWSSNSNEDLDKFVSRRTQEGGTGMVVFGEAASMYNSSNSGFDSTGLGRYTYVEIKGEEGFSTMVLTGYVPCKNSSPYNGTSYQQQKRYFVKIEGTDVCPRRRFLEDLKALVLQWKEEGKRVIVMLDANEDVYSGKIGRMLTDPLGPDMVETVLATTHAKLGATYFRGSKPIDAIWASKDLKIVGAGAMPVGFGVGDHRMMWVDIQADSMVGFQPQPVKHPKARRLNSRIPRAKKAYNKRLEHNIVKHRLREKMMEAHNANLSPEALKERLDKIDQMSRDFRLHAKCRKEEQKGS